MARSRYSGTFASEGEGRFFRQNKKTMTAPVLIVGAGPVGLTMACELARYRVPLRIIDKSASRTDKSKALAV